MSQLIQRKYLVIGSGLAGLYTALKLAKLGSVALVTKAGLEESNTFFAQGGIAAAIDPKDSPLLHYQDTIAAGAGLCRTEAVEVLVNEGPDRVRDLIELGVPFDRGTEGVALTKEAAHSRHRILHALGDATGRAISQALAARVKEDSHITIWEHTMVTALLLAEDTCGGADAVNTNGGWLRFLAEATVLCTGGCGQLYAITTNPDVATGDGVVLAYMAGAQVTDMEFMQFHPTALVLPGTPHFLISETVRGEGGVLRNAADERFMVKYHELADLAPRDIVARAIADELAKTGGDHVTLDLSALSAERIKSRFPNIYETCRQYGLDISTAPIPVAPAAHYMMGGVATDLWGRSSLAGLFACGEVACTGVHGANRLASNSLLEDLVFAHRIAMLLADKPLSLPDPERLLPVPEVRLPVTEDPHGLTKDLRQLMTNAAGIARTGGGLAAALDRSRSFKLETPAMDTSLASRESGNMLTVMKLILQAAFLRTESRGCHFRTDCPQADPIWARRLYFSRDADTLGEPLSGNPHD